MSFAAQVAKFAEKANTNSDEAVRGITLKLASSLIDMSPVGNPDLWKSSPPQGYVGGRFRANWQLGVNEVPGGTLNTEDKSGGQTKTKLAAAIAEITAGGVLYITNNLPYAIPLEYGHSTQAPQGMVRITVARYQSIIGQVVRSLS